MTKLKELAQLRRQVRRLIKPSGTKKSPARSCVDLQLNKPHISDGKWVGLLILGGCDSVKHSGYYWIDPNGGCPKDAIKVFCNFSAPAVQTCVMPSTDQVVTVPTVTMATRIIHIRITQVNTRYWHKASADNWFSNLDGGFQLKYTTTEDQLKFIRTGAHTAHQTFTYT